MSEVNNISEREKPFMHIYVTALGTWLQRLLTQKMSKISHTGWIQSKLKWMYIYCVYNVSEGVSSLNSDKDHLVITRKLLDSIFNIDGDQNHHTTDLVEYKRLFFQKVCWAIVWHTLTDVLDTAYHKNKM
jgi:hypothetical protein